MAFVRPSLYLRMDLDSRAYFPGIEDEISRAYSYIAMSSVVSHEVAEDERPENTMRFIIKLHKPYWQKGDAASDELWDGMMLKWLKNMFYKTSSTIVNTNTMRKEENTMPATPYAWLELEFAQNAFMAFKTASDSALPMEGVQWADQIRTLVAEGALGEGIACVRVPSRENYEAQLAAAMEGWNPSIADDAEDVQPVEESDETAEQKIQAEDAVDEQEEVASEPEVERYTFPELPVFDVDYRIWGVEYADGSVRQFDSETASFID